MTVTRWFSFAAVAIIATVLLAGCALGGDQAQQTHEVEPGAIVAVLPSRPGLSPAGPVTPVDAAGYATALVGHPDAALASSLSDAGFRRGATRTWTGADGASLTAAVGLWDDGEPANAIGGQAVDAMVPDGQAWNPAEFGGSQGARSDTARALSVVVGRVSLFLRATGTVDDAAVLRQMDLMRQSAAGTGSDNG